MSLEHGGGGGGCPPLLPLSLELDSGAAYWPHAPLLRSRQTRWPAVPAALDHLHLCPSSPAATPHWPRTEPTTYSRPHHQTPAAPGPTTRVRPPGLPPPCAGCYWLCTRRLPHPHNHHALTPPPPPTPPKQPQRRQRHATWAGPLGFPGVLDPHYFRDEDGQEYLYGSGIGVGIYMWDLSPDLTTVGTCK